MTIPQYKYIKGQEVLSDEHMLSATELAKLYGLYTLNGKPNGLLVCHFLADYIKDNNLNISDFYYVHSHGAMKVYPKMLYVKALNDLCFELEMSGKEGTNEIYIIKDKIKGKSKINFIYKKIPRVKTMPIERNINNGRK